MKDKIIRIFNEHTNNFIYTDDNSFEINGIDKDDYKEVADEIVKLFAISDVSKQRELLIAIFNKLTGEDVDCLLAEKFEEVADRRLRNL